MFRKTFLFFIVLVVAAIPGFAQPEQEPAETDASATASDTEVESNAEADAESEPQSYAPVEGDIVYLKSGKELRGVTVGRENPLYIEVEYLPGETPLKLPRTAVDRIDYAADRLSGRSGEGLGDVRLLPTVMLGEEVSADFQRMLLAQMSEEALPLENVDYLVIIREFASKFNVLVDVAEELEKVPVEERKFTRTIIAGQTFFNFLRIDLAEIAPNVRVILQFDKLVLQKREDAAPPAGDVPPPPTGDIPPPPAGAIPPPPAQ